MSGRPWCWRGERNWRGARSAHLQSIRPHVKGAQCAILGQREGQAVGALWADVVVVEHELLKVQPRVGKQHPQPDRGRAAEIIVLQVQLRQPRATCDAAHGQTVHGACCSNEARLKVKVNLL
jgi:hypothetical protein